MSPMTIRYDKKLNKFVVQCPMWANDALDGFMSRRWSKAQRAWLVPVVKRNIHFADVDLRGMGVQISAEAEDAIADAKVKYGAPPKPEPFPAWYKFKTKPRAHQMAMLQRLYGLRAMGLIMGMGTGKSKGLIDLLCALRMEDRVRCALIICKRTLRGNWVEQFGLHAPLPVSIHLPETGEQGVKRFMKWSTGKADLKVMIVGTESLSNGGMGDICAKFLMMHTQILTAIDESHMIATPGAIRTDKVISFGRMSDYRAILTGTSIKDGPLNFFTPFEFLDPDIIGIGDYYAFRNRYAIMGGYREKLSNGSFGQPKEIVGYQNVDELITTIAPYVYQITKEEALPHLPPKGYERRRVPLTKEQLDLIRKMKADRGYELNGKEIGIKNVLELALRIHQVCGGWTVDKMEVNLVDGRVKMLTTPTRVIPAAKNPKLLELRDILENLQGRSVIIWAAYMPEVEDIMAMIRAEFPKQVFMELTGRTPDDTRERNKYMFQEGGRWLVGNVQTGGTGYTLTACEYMIYYNNTNKFIEREQSEDRAHRDGLEHPVMYVDLIAEGTNVEQLLLDAFAVRKDLVEYVQELIRKATLQL